MHVDPELLALLALGEIAGTAAEREHVRTCPVCAEEVSELRGVVTLGRSISPETTMSTPSPGVWTRIREELRFPPTGSPRRSGSDPLHAEPLHAEPLHAETLHAEPLHAEPLHAETGMRYSVLAPVDELWSRASGTAELAIDERGRRVLQVDLSAELPSSGVRQAWLVHRDDPTVRQSLGILDGPHGLWTVEQAIDLQQYAILDISQQAIGENEHSGQTIVRGELTLAS